MSQKELQKEHDEIRARMEEVLRLRQERALRSDDLTEAWVKGKTPKEREAAILEVLDKIEAEKEEE